MRALKNFLMLPMWLIQVFSWAKSFKTNPVLGSWVLNACGLHVARVVISHALFHFRLQLLQTLADPGDRRAFAEQGFLIKPDFLPVADFTALKREIENYRGPMLEGLEGNTLTQRVFLTRRERRSLPECARLTADPRLLRLLRYCSSKNRVPFFYLENLQQNANDEGARDSQKDLHSDTFHPCIKAWLYLDATNSENGPFEYVPGSHRLSWRRLCWEYQQSLQASRTGAPISANRYWDGSFRVNDTDRTQLQLKPTLSMAVPPNTLVIANVHGFHRRGDAGGTQPRLAIWMQSRDNPFNPLFTPLPTLTAQVFEWAWSSYLERESRRAAGNGLWQRKYGSFARQRHVS